MCKDSKNGDDMPYRKRNGSGSLYLTHFFLDYCCGELGKLLCLRLAIPISWATSYLNFSNSGVSWTIGFVVLAKAYTSLEIYLRHQTCFAAAQYRVPLTLLVILFDCLNISILGKSCQEFSSYSMRISNIFWVLLIKARII